jgi:hypothetical protein
MYLYVQDLFSTLCSKVILPFRGRYGCLSTLDSRAFVLRLARGSRHTYIFVVQKPVGSETFSTILVSILKVSED